LRIVLGAPGALPEWPLIDEGVTSALLRVEACRTLDRLLHDRLLHQDDYSPKVAEVDNVLKGLTVVPTNDRVLNLACARLPVRLNTLDMIHLSSALDFVSRRSLQPSALAFATHDVALANAARAAGFPVLGV
jgi:hypothetical protein